MMMILVPALGAPTEELLQDTLKSVLVSFFALTTAFVFFWDLRQQQVTVNFHKLMWLPLGLMAYALGSMAWSHVYLAGVESIRWFLFSLIFFLGANTWTHNRVTYLAWGIHLGAVLASLWAALQFWVDFPLFAQGPNPASTFVNRNFFGEFIVCTFPFSVLLITRVRDKTSVFLLTFSLGFNIVALMMAGTRSALIGLLTLAFLLPVIVLRYQKQVVSSGWKPLHCFALVAVLIATIGSLGAIETRNSKLIADFGAMDALDRAFARSLSLTDPTEYTHKSFSVRAVIWKSTLRMIAANPLVGVGAGAWEVRAPNYQTAGTQLETDYYAHNEILQLIAEYGLVGWLFLACLASYLVWAAYITWSNHDEHGQTEAPLRALSLASLLVFLIVSNAGFPWRMASTGALFALSLSLLAASDGRLGAGTAYLSRTINWKHQFNRSALTAMGLCSILAVYIAQQAIECESKIVRAVKIAMTITQSGNANDPRWENVKTDMFQLLREGIAINPHYRKLSPIVADSVASWGDWKDAIWIWESVLESRPNVVALLSNLTRGHLQQGNLQKAQETLDRAKFLQPTSPDVAALEVMLWSRTGKEQEAATRAKALLRGGSTMDPDLVRTAYYLGMRIKDPALAIQALEFRIKTWPNQAVDGWLKLGNIYDAPEAKNEKKAIQSYKAAINAANPAHKKAILKMIPPAYHDKIQ